MPNELTVGAVQPVVGPVEKAADPKAEPFAASTTSAGNETPQLFVNPKLAFDSTLGLLVFEFRDSSGNVSASIPSQRQLEAYRLHEQPLPGQKAARAQPTTGDAITARPPSAAHLAVVSLAPTAKPATVASQTPTLTHAAVPSDSIT